MKIYSLSKVLILPLAIMAIAIFYYSETTGNRNITIWLFLPTILLTIVLIFKPQIDYWWHTKHPIPLDNKIKEWLSKYSNYYKDLNTDDKGKFENRLSLYIEAREFKSVGSEVRDVPEDLKGIIGSIPVMLTMNRDDFLLGDYDRIYMYKHPFPTPRFKFLHSVETNHEDGMVLFSLEHLLAGMTRPKEIYNIGLHAFIEAYYQTFKVDFPENTAIGWKQIESSGDHNEQHILDVTGLKYIDLYVVAGVNFFISPEKMEKNNPQLFTTISSIFTSTGK